MEIRRAAEPLHEDPTVAARTPCPMMAEGEIMPELNTTDLDGTIFISDNLPFLKALDTESVDLVCIDPPFDKNETLTDDLRPPLSKEEHRIEQELLVEWGAFDEESAYKVGIEYPDQDGSTAKFEDIFRFDQDVHEDWMQSIEERNPGLALLIESTRYTHSDSRAAYIAFMAERMLEIRRILKPTGSVYLHCDDAANGYLRQLMDAVFGKDNFRNEIAWKRTNAPTASEYRFGRVHDTIFMYAKSAHAKVNPVYIPYAKEYIGEHFRFEDEGGRFQVTPLTAQGTRRGHSGRPWRGVDVTDRGLHWASPSALPEGVEKPKEYEGMTSQEKLDWLDTRGLIYWPKRGRMPRFKRYLSTSQGTRASDLITDIPGIQGSSIERTGYPTQKPQALAQRIIEASTNPGDIVLDCFAGCAYVPVAAQLLGRQWIACDMSPRAWTVVRRQFHKHPDLGIVTEGEIAADRDGVKVNPKLETAKRIIKVRGPHQLPIRTTPDEHDAAPVRMLSRPRYKVRPHESDQQIWNALVEYWGPACWYCGAEKTNDRRELQLDHVEANKRDGTNDDCWNRALACIACNSDKSNKLTPTETVEVALNQGRISTLARSKEVKAMFAARRQWAKDRWERIRPRKDGIRQIETIGEPSRFR